MQEAVERRDYERFGSCYSRDSMKALERVDDMERYE
jgi:hypothetical protein